MMIPSRLSHLVLPLALAIVLVWSVSGVAENAIRYSNARVEPGESFDIEMTMSNDIVISGAAIYFRWSSPDLTLEGVTILKDRFVGTIIDTTMQVDPTERTGGVLFLRGFGIFDQGWVPPGSGVLARLHFRVSPDASAQVAYVDSVFKIIGENGTIESQYSDFQGLHVIYPKTYRGQIIIGDAEVQAQLETNPSSLAFEATTGGINPVGQTVYVETNDGARVLWSAQWQAPWLTMTPSSAETPTETYVEVDVTGLDPGTYSETIEISSDGVDGDPVSIAVSLTVFDEGAVTLTAVPDRLLVGAGSGGEPVQRRLSLTTSGKMVDWTATWTANWLTVLPAAGATPLTADVVFYPDGLDVGGYTDSIVITASGITNSPVIVPISFTVSAETDDTPGSEAARREPTLNQNHPNPFGMYYRRPVTTIGYEVATQDRVEITIYDVLGRTVRTLVSETVEAGPQSVQWDGRDSEGNTVSSGHYFYRLETSTGSVVKRMTIIK